MNLKILNTYSELFDNKKAEIKIVKFWLTNKRVLNILKLHKIDLNIFVKKYALEICRTHIGIIKAGNIIEENSDSIEAFVSYLKENNISIGELFIICNGLKNALIEYANEVKIVNIQLANEINFIHEESFLKILFSYSKSISKIEKKLVKRDDLVDKYVIMSRLNTQGEILNVSQAFCDISGYEKEELIGKSYDSLKHPTFKKEKLDGIWKSINNGKVWHGEIKNQNKNGKAYWVEATITPIFDEDGKIVYFDSIRQDITSKKELEEQQSILIEQSKSAAMGEMISMIAHQWRQPLQAVAILIQKLPLTKLKDGEIPDELLDQVVNNVTLQLEYMSKTIDDFRDFFLPDKPKEKITVADLIDKTLDFVSFMLKGDSISINKNIEESVTISVYISELIQVLINIIKNARDILVERKIEEKRISINSYIKDSFVVISIEDNAKGIPVDIIGKIFEPYFSTKKDKNGTGLGLYMSKTIVEKHLLGSLDVKNSEIGAKFTIKLPIS